MLNYLLRGNRFITRFINLFYNRISLRHNAVKYSSFSISGRIIIRNLGLINIGRNFCANSGVTENAIGGDTVLRLVTRTEGKLFIGDNVGISNSTIVCWDNIRIGNYVYIGGGCKIWDTDFHSIDPIVRRHKGDNNIVKTAIVIEDYVFIGGSSIILKGVTIGKNSIIGAGSVVAKSVPANEIWAGNPARFIRNI